MKMNALKKFGRASVLATAFALAAASPGFAQQSPQVQAAPVLTQPVSQGVVLEQPTAQPVTTPTVTTPAPLPVQNQQPAQPAQETHHTLRNIFGAAALLALLGGGVMFLRRRKDVLPPGAQKTGDFHWQKPEEPSAPAVPAAAAQAIPVVIEPLPAAPVVQSAPVAAEPAPAVTAIAGAKDDTAAAVKPRKFEI